MTGWRTHPDIPLELEAPPRGLAKAIDLAIEVLLIVMLAFMPFAMGAVQPWSEALVMFASVGLASLLLFRSLVQQDNAGHRTWAMLPLVLFIALVILQLIPLPALWIGKVSGNTLADKYRLVKDVAGASSFLQQLTLSFYPPATRHDLRVVLVAATVFVTVLQVARRTNQIARLLIAITCIGAGVALVAVAQDLSGADRIYWTVETPARPAVAGPFVLYNNFAQHVNLSMGAALALLFCQLAGLQVAPQVSARRADRNTPRRSAAENEIGQNAWARATTGQKWTIAALSCFVILGGCCILVSGSRGGTLSMIGAFVVSGFLLARGRKHSMQRWTLMLVGLAVFCVILFAGFDVICDRLATLYNRPDPSSGRIQTYKDMGRVWAKFPVLGIGLGAHQYVYPAYDRSRDPGLSEQADGDYIQAAEETGAVGLGLIFCFAGIIIWHFVKVVSRHRDHENLAGLAYGLAYGLLAVILHSITDFGQHLLAIACLSATFCALMINLSRQVSFSGRVSKATSKGTLRASTPAMPEEEEDTPAAAEPRVSFWTRLQPAGIAAGLVAATIWSASAAEHVRRGAVNAAIASDIASCLAQNDWQGTDDQYAVLIQSASAAIAEVPDDVRFSYDLNCYRWHAVSRVLNQTTDHAPSNEQSIAAAAQIVDDLHRARLLCPTFGPIYAVAGQIEQYVLNQPRGAQDITTAFSLSSNNPDVCLAAATASASAQQWDDALEKLRRCVQLNGGYYSQALPILIDQGHRPDLAVALAADDSNRLLELARHLAASIDGLDPSLVQGVRAQALEKLKKQCTRDDLPVGLLAGTAYLCRDNKDLPSAVDLFHRALTKDYARVDWHLSLAQTLRSQGLQSEAMHEARICLNLRPQMPEAVQMIAELSVAGDNHRSEVGN